ncbi:hypothetical protein BKA70DRAFT_1221778 [Coprinopsis sp. MPI-PUGE-AT-0042]|nr:hypothetical protein BKA70DRAFT_1221778 [Coprinopsis sp. MPI-PUGE-AT-0042]
MAAICLSRNLQYPGIYNRAIASDKSSNIAFVPLLFPDSIFSYVGCLLRGTDLQANYESKDKRSCGRSRRTAPAYGHWVWKKKAIRFAAALNHVLSHRDDTYLPLDTLGYELHETMGERRRLRHLMGNHISKKLDSRYGSDTVQISTISVQDLVRALKLEPGFDHIIPQLAIYAPRADIPRGSQLSLEFSNYSQKFHKNAISRIRRFRLLYVLRSIPRIQGSLNTDYWPYIASRSITVKLGATTSTKRDEIAGTRRAKDSNARILPPPPGTSWNLSRPNSLVNEARQARLPWLTAEAKVLGT